jgi:sigma-E factor negative regulatory protein RseB
VIPEKQRIVQEELKGTSTTLAAPFRYSEELDNYYEMKTFAKGKVADRDTQVIVIRARDKYRYSYRLSVDIETALPLKVQVMDDKDQVVELVLYTSIDYVDVVAAAELDPVIDTHGFSWIRPVKAEFDADRSELWGVTRLPAGFHLSAAKISLLAGSEYPVQHLIYTDGLATVSVFIAHPKSDFTMPEGFSSAGSLNAYSLTINGRLATALGEVPRRTVYRIATELNAR